MNKADVISFFDALAPSWDGDMILDEDLVREILDRAGVRPGADVLDVACGTGVLVPFYLARGAASVTGVDLSPAMADLAREKYARDSRVTILCADAEQMDLGRTYDAVVVYNAFPHFGSPRGLLQNLARHTRPGGRLTVAHGMSRERILAHHSGSAAAVSAPLPEADDLARLFAPWYDVDTVLSDERMYQVAGTRKREEEQTESTAEDLRGGAP